MSNDTRRPDEPSESSSKGEGRVAFLRAAYRFARLLDQGSDLDKKFYRSWSLAKRKAKEPVPDDLSFLVAMVSAVAETRRRFMTVPQLLNRPTLRWIVHPFLGEGSLAILYGPPGVGKTFLCLGWAAAVVTGRPWLGHPVMGGTVIYIAAEGVGGLPKRIRALQVELGSDGLDGLLFYPEPVNLLDPDAVELLIEAARKHRPVLIIFDTLARCMVGGDENSAKDMGLVIASLDRIRHALGSTVLGVHHSGKRKGSGERGSSALRGAADTMLELSGKSDALRFKVSKQKDAERAPDLYIRLEPIGESCVVVGSKSVSSSIPATDRLALTLVSSEISPQGLTHTEWRAACHKKGISKSTFARVLKRLVKDGFVEKTGGKDKSSRGARYITTAEGRQALGLIGPNSVPPSSETEGQESVSGSLSPKGERPVDQPLGPNQEAITDDIDNQSDSSDQKKKGET